MNKFKLFCIPHAGASASVYYKWFRDLDDTMIDLYPLELKGRGARLEEPFYSDFNEMMNDVYGMVTNILSTKDSYMLFGHSMGAYVAFRLESMLERKLGVKAAHVFLSGREAPIVWGENKRKISHLNNQEFLHEIKSYGGIDENYLHDQDVLDMILPIIRNDFRIIETLDTSDKNKCLQSPITILNGKEDFYNPENIDLWNNYSSASCQFKYYSGGHFYMEDHLEELNHCIYEIAKKNFDDAIILKGVCKYKRF
ncbi:thioesterase II family protein [Virgibacillus sp. Bac330]|uniref:thioesterase II family protein n=1 Tax=Virgibacillus sp. Bac330 TaxID=2419841 RepID=UPI000EF47855|nr:thioesterase domain-containing protein [Virgibacillus sp. Bac330]